MSTSDCAACREYLLAAEPDALRDGGEWREHLRTCRACAADARAILAGNEAVANALAGITASHPATRDAPGPHVPPPAGRAAARRRALRRWAPALASLAAAAAVLLVLRPQAHAPSAVLPPLTAAPEPAVKASVVNAAGGSGVAIMPTTDPDIIVVWTF